MHEARFIARRSRHLRNHAAPRTCLCSFLSLPSLIVVCCLWHPPPHNAHTIQLTNLILLTNYTPPTYFSTTLRSRLPPPALAQPAAATSNCVARDVAVFPHRVENAAAELRDFEASVEPRPRRVERLRVAVLVR